MYITTRSTFYAYNSKFLENIANSDSTITSIKTN